METLSTIDTARRLLRSHGIDDAQLAEAAKERLTHYQLATSRAWEDVVLAWDEDHPALANPSPEEAEGAEAAREAALGELRREFEAELWLTGSVLQLQRQWGGRCVSCVHWDANQKAQSDHAAPCPRLIAGETDALVEITNPEFEPMTAPAFGCILWGEIPADDPETLRARAELAMAVGLLPRMPEGA